MKTSKRILTLFFALCMLLAEGILSASADNVLQLPKNIEIIQEEAFYCDTSLDEIVLPDGITTIGNKAFGYSSLKKIRLPSSLTSIADDAFIGCSLETIECDQGTSVWDWCVNHGYQDILTTWSVHVTSEDTGEGSLRVWWSEVKNANRYELYYDTVDKDWFWSPVIVPVGNVTEYTLTGLQNDTTYYVWIKAYRDSTELRESDDVSAKTTGENPNPQYDPIPLWAGPDIRDVYSTFVGIITIEYDEFAGATGYHVHFKDPDTNEVMVTVYTNAEEKTQNGLVTTDAWVNDVLSDNTTYAITVQAIGSSGTYISEESTAVYYTTDFSEETGDIEEDIIYPSAISLNIDKKEMRVGDSFDLTATILPADVSQSANEITWGSYDESVAIVEDGEVYANGIGATAVYAYTLNGLYAYCQITVLPDPDVAGYFEDGNTRMIVKFGYEDQLSYHVETQYTKLINVQLVQVNGNSKTPVFTNNHTGQTTADGHFTISAAPGGRFRSLGSVYTFNLVATLSDGTEVTLDTATVEIGFWIPKTVENVEARYSSGKIYVSWDNQGDAKRFKVIYIQADDAWATPGYVDVDDEDAEDAVIPASAIEMYKTYLIYVVAYPTDSAGYASRSDPVRVTTASSSTPAVTARFVGNRKVYAPGETIQIEITYNNVVKVHYHNGDISYNANSLQTGNNTGDIGVFSSNRSGTQIVELEAQSVSGYYMVEINAKNKNDVQASDFYNYTTIGGIDCLGLSYYVDADGLEAPSWRTSRSMTAIEDLYWSAVQGATGYRLWISTTDNISDAEAINLGNTQYYSLNDLNTGRIYYVWVQAVNSNGGGGISPAKVLSLVTDTPSVSAKITSNNITVGGTVPISITYTNVIKVHYQNGTPVSDEDDNNIWADSQLKEMATETISGTQTVVLPAQNVPGEYEVVIWAKDAKGNQATSAEGYKLKYTVTGAPKPTVSLSLCPESSATVSQGAYLSNTVWLTHTYTNTTKLTYELYQGVYSEDNLRSFTNYYHLKELKETSKSSIIFDGEPDDIKYSSDPVTKSMTFIPSDELQPGVYTLRVTASNNYGNETATAEVEITILEFDPIWPASRSYEISCLYYYASGEPHKTRYDRVTALTAIDIAGNGNALATESGVVYRTGYQANGFGNWIEIKHSNGLISLYAHLASINPNMKIGQSISKGDIIGVIGNTGGLSKGTHLHFEISGCNPMRDYFYSKYKTSFVFQKPVYNNNNSYNSDKWITSIISNEYILSNGKYIYRN